MGKYDDIINLPHHESLRHPRMSMHDRAAQFTPFMALKGYDDVIEETQKEKIHDVDHEVELINPEIL